MVFDDFVEEKARKISKGKKDFSVFFDVSLM